MSVFLKLTYKFNTLPTKIPTELFVLILKFIWKIKTILEKNKVRNLPYQFKTYNKATDVMSHN